MNRKEDVSIFTGETIPAIFSGLAVTDNDKIWSVGKNGDVAIALYGLAKLVVVGEKRDDQRRIIEMKASCLQDNMVDAFLNLDDIFTEFEYPNPRTCEPCMISTPRKLAFERRYAYFKEHVEVIGDKFKSSPLAKQHQFYLLKHTATQSDFFDKIYLSNLVSNSSFPNIKETLYGYSAKLIPQGLMYISNHIVLTNPTGQEVLSPNEIKTIGGTQRVLDHMSFQEPVLKMILPDNLVLDRDLTQSAWSLLADGDISNPAVYRKVK